MSNDENFSNLNTKYNRLISDYKNLREKHNLLKNALIAEREKSKELETVFVENGVQSRKVLQELESLKFRNDMLSKQINTLRDELEHEKQPKTSRKSNNKIQTKHDDIEIIKEELVNKINECSNLHSQLTNIKLEYQMESNNFRSAINDLENQLKLVKSQSNTSELNIRKALGNEIEERSALELKLENKDNIIQKLENSQKNLLQEVNELKKLLNHSISPPNSIICQREIRNDIDNYSLKSKDLKKSNSINGSLSSIPNNESLSTNEIYICSLIDKIGQLEQRNIALELENQIIAKRQKMEKLYRNLYEDYIIKIGNELPKLESGKCQTLTVNSANFNLSDNDQFITEFYEMKFTSLNKQLYEAIAKAALYFDEAKSMTNRLEIEQREIFILREEIESMKQKIILGQEDLELTRDQYDLKIREMSIHLAELNTQIETKKINSQKSQIYNENLSGGNDNISSIKGFLHSFKK